MASYSPGCPDTADAVVVGGGTIGAWCAYFLRKAGLERVVLVEKGVLGQGASSRAAGVVRLQGGTPEAVRLGIWSRRFYLGQRAEFGTDSGFVSQGYLLPCFTTAEVEAVATFHTMVKLHPCGKYVLSICTNPSCTSVEPA